MENRKLYHGSTQIIEFPEIRTARFNKDFYFGFYCTILPQQARRWATRFTGTGIINEYIYTPDNNLKILTFHEMTEEWLDFITVCRMGKSHTYDIVEGPMQMIQSLIMFRILLMVKFQEQHSGNWQNSKNLLIKSVFILHELSQHLNSRKDMR